MKLTSAFTRFIDPPREFGLIPFWFWNDDLQEAELLAQLHAFHQAGFGGVLPHARVGLSRRVGYLSEEYFRLFRRVVEETARLGMKIILYDEASYPSGSARGGVVAANADYASQAIGLWEKQIKGPYVGFWRPNTGRALLDRHVCTILGKTDDGGRVDPASLTLLEPRAHTLFRLALPAGDWKVMSVWNTASGGQIRGAFPEEESGHATAPAAGDILNPAAVACFLRLTHEQYYARLEEFFGDPIIALFTDEPGVFGKGAQRPKNARPFTPGFVEWLTAQWGTDPRPWLPALWVDYGPDTENFRRQYAAAVQSRLHQVFYAAQSDWCARHRIALTGHPAGSDELSSLRYFQLPGQDMVWRYVEPGKPSALEGPHSVAAKAAASAARLTGARRALTEVCGAYGWRLTLDEIKWLFDWHLVRGNNLISPHAVFYSIRDRRAWESEPDLGIHNVFWPYFQELAHYARRLCWLLCDGEHCCTIAILGDGNALPWQAARQLYQQQLDFLYLDDRAVAESRVTGGLLTAGTQTYRAIVVDGDPQLSGATREKLDAFQRGGGLLIHYRQDMDLAARLDQELPRDLRLDPGHPDLRYLHYRKQGLDFYLLVNEGEEPLAGELALGVSGSLEAWDPLTAKQRPVEAYQTGERLRVRLELERRDSLVLAIDPGQPFVPPPPLPRCRLQPLAMEPDWQVRTPDGAAVDLPVPGDWSRQPGWELFSGTLCYAASFTAPRAGELWLDLGKVGDLVEVWVDGRQVGQRRWAPYRLCLGEGLETGLHHLELRITNTMANEYEGLQLPSGLLGPLRWSIPTPR